MLGYVSARLQNGPEIVFKEIRSRRFRMRIPSDFAKLAILVASVLLFSGCDASSGRNSKKKTSDVSASETADYATGLTPISTQKKAEKIVGKIYTKQAELERKALKDNSPQK